ncbi:PREDICTED: leucine-rich repeat-containing protein 51-like [Ceratosolen solmsi marchali]|uniref:Leucine-rich repeat-containing protein 51 n=1 Tax=Ceratosolen solmsi marchali TaxID=326594 RepID=A0AAJ7DZF4_9HYME|nr:PREDICTED: leucine-rich repeat-containing protein 51-like [Ceratosolen solmsi marchali]
MANKSPLNNRFHYHREENELMHAGPPLDLSFKNASTCDELVNRSIQSNRIRKLPEKTENNRFLTSSMWLSNNSLTTLSRLGDLANKFLEKPSDLRWLDLAYNKICGVDEDLLKFQNLTILYLHGNEICDIKCILKLRDLRNLRTLTLHGNPIERMPSYRRYVIAILPQISNLDFSSVIDTEKKRALPAGFFKTISS